MLEVLKAVILQTMQLYFPQRMAALELELQKAIYHKTLNDQIPKFSKKYNQLIEIEENKPSPNHLDLILDEYVNLKLLKDIVRQKEVEEPKKLKVKIS